MFCEKPDGSDLFLEVSSLSKEGVYKEAVRGLAFMTGAYFGAHTGREEPFSIRGSSDEEILVLLLEEVLFRNSKDGNTRLPVSVHGEKGNLTGRFVLYKPFFTGALLTVKGVTWHGLSFIFEGSCWRATLLFDL
ncbi:MAG TPA: archease [Candidatus Mcinerneyibacteriales bacterium]|nr:archease [Candidatus Mcinerneyibacteriales bacterium]HPE20178.1 archease [Candidatus Mcinerneyibacteriales bacterium]HPJ69390.1 archease [Candidatus Mcinerneyibacteriales bacterium]HPQ90212.1 archease [Candidatus Mcinerneyibacteriales bacterium]